MSFYRFLMDLERTHAALLSVAPAPAPAVKISTILRVINLYCSEVGKITFRYIPDPTNRLQAGNFIWLDEERTSPYDEPYRDAIVYLNEYKTKDNLPFRRLVSTKELMHIFDSSDERAGSRETVSKLLAEIASQPTSEFSSAPYKAEGEARWKAYMALIPPTLREKYLNDYRQGSISADDLSCQLQVPAFVVEAVMLDNGGLYEKMLQKFREKEELRSKRNLINQGSVD
ncbi:MAG: hypothetical protein ACTIDN_06525 [Acetobacter sp.]|uniref:hypothetical protein n=1 Tax=Acetobacter sp. TaxID=440 RepID=UPI003F9223C1